MPIVMRLRLRSATPELPELLVTPPPNMSDRPPPLPLCSRTSGIEQEARDDEQHLEGDRRAVHAVSVPYWRARHGGEPATLR